MTAEDAINVFKDEFCGLEAYCEIHRDGLCLTDGCEVWWAIKALEQYKVGVQPVRHGHWIPIGNVDADGNQYYNCSICECGETHVPRIQVYYCWNCGARMDGEQND